jgi:uncharacterized protein (TIGR02246 family)
MRSFKIYLWALMACLFLSTQACVFAQQGEQAEQEAIRQQFKDFSQTFAKHNPEEMVNYWTADGTYLDPTTGQYVKGRDALIEEYKLWFNQNHANQAVVTPREINFLSPNEAGIQGDLKVSFSDNKPPKENAFAALMRKENGKWLIQEARQITLKSAPTTSEELRSLAWLVGNWEDDDENVDIIHSTKWNKNKNMLIQHFSMSIYGQDVMDARQIIAWDPIEKKIRSWVFDSDGGFGQGTWYEHNGSWFIKNVYTLADGRKATAVNIYKKINDNSYTWASVGRDVNGEILPDIEPVTVTRIESNEVENE